MYSVPVSSWLARLAGAHGALLAHELVRVVRGPVPGVPVVQPHVIQVVPVRDPDLASEDEHPRLVVHDRAVAAPPGRAVVAVEPAIAEGLHLRENVAREHGLVDRAAGQDQRDDREEERAASPRRQTLAHRRMRRSSPPRFTDVAREVVPAASFDFRFKAGGVTAKDVNNDRSDRRFSAAGAG